jgi:hypothetical protein
MAFAYLLLWGNQRPSSACRSFGAGLNDLLCVFISMLDQIVLILMGFSGKRALCQFQIWFMNQMPYICHKKKFELVNYRSKNLKCQQLYKE